jgi:NAD(P) transhydrogenase subunit beta
METLIILAYVASGVLFIYGIKGLTHPRTAVRGNMLGASGMALAAVATLFVEGMGFGWIIAGIIIGSAIGAVLATRVQMTEMPELVALFNGFGGLGSFLVAAAEMHGGSHGTQEAVAIAAAGLIGAVTFWGSLVAYGKLAEKYVPGNAVIFPNQQLINAGLLVASLGLIVWLALDPAAWVAFWLLFILASVLGVLSVIRIGGGDMPVVISLLNSYSGLAAAAAGFILSNTVLIVAGSLVGASGLILTQIMCVAMNRSLPAVLFGTLGPAEGGKKLDVAEIYKNVKSTSADEVAMLFDVAQRVVFVPGYGMAVAQCQHGVRDLANLLEARGVEVEYAIHPVAGRMPGHMNVLLAEADVPYDKLKEMDESNASFERVDVVVVIGANDVVNPIARTDPTSPLAGMPILDVDKAKSVVIIKRSLSPGFAGVPNPLFAAPNAYMYFGDAKQNVLDMVAAVKAS